jgi:hypothetical protein
MKMCGLHYILREIYALSLIHAEEKWGTRILQYEEIELCTLNVLLLCEHFGLMDSIIYHLHGKEKNSAGLPRQCIKLYVFSILFDLT